MPLCESCRRPVNKYVPGCDLCDSRAEREAERARRGRLEEAHETARFRDRCALRVLISLMHINGDTTSFHINAGKAYLAADAMLAERAKRPR